MSEIQNRYDFVLLFDVTDGNPNGDPDAGNMPRVDPQTGQGLVTDVCLKRKIRNYVTLAKELEPPYEIYVKEGSVLNETNRRAYQALDIEVKEKNQPREDVNQTREWMCRNFFDVRTFGAVMSTGVNCGQVRGPVQLTFSRSVEPILHLEHSITRMAVTTEAESKKQGGGNRTMGRKATIPYGLYVGHGFISPQLARQTGFSEEDLSLLWESLEHMFDHDRSAARGLMTVRGLYVFKHRSALGDAQAHQLFDRVQIQVEKQPARRFEDFAVRVNESDLPDGVELLKLV